MNHIEQIALEPCVQSAITQFRTRQLDNINLIQAIQQIPAPTFAEAERAAFVESHMLALGLHDVRQDDLHNVYGRFPGQHRRAPLIITAHLDTVFPLETDLRIRENGRLLSGPGIGDNSTGVAGLLLLAKSLIENQIQLTNDVWLVANVCEEGLGDLRGIRAVVEKFGQSAKYIIVEGGLFGQISHQAIGVRRFRLEVSGPGGHSWGSFGAASAIHVLGHLISAIDKLPVPTSPRTTYNVGIIEGGTSINTIAQSAALQLDLRSEEPSALQQLVDSVTDIVQQTNQLRRDEGIHVTMTAIGSRPPGQISRHTALVKTAVDALHYVGSQGITFMMGSTDANVPLSKGFTAVVLGLTESGNAHRLDEFIDPTRLPDGLSQLLLVTLATAGFPHR
ncbi:MAG: M20/M25/M40 family metallo-hydrolase [Chloroflexi bacterium]|nr:M20/M25/M40 family metallo-hydrolase [Chloroflexota bacterium]MBK8934944.1 M20/M25/M40 family metallo-hydrolase [Chloroflexota bacterium]